MPKNYFNGLRDAKVTQRLPFMDPNHMYKLKLEKTHVIETRDKGDAFIAEFEVLATTSPNHKVGTRVGYFQSLLKKDIAFANIKLLLYSCLGLDYSSEADQAKIQEVDKEIDAEMNKAVTENHMAGAVLRCQTVERIGRDSKKPYTANNWLPA